MSQSFFFVNLDFYIEFTSSEFVFFFFLKSYLFAVAIYWAIIKTDYELM